MKFFLISILIGSFAYSMQQCQVNAEAQTNPETMNRRFEIEGFQIDSAEQVVYCQQMTGGYMYDSNGNINGQWDGYEYVPCTDIDFKTTSLIFMGSSITFKEFFPIPTADISSLRVIQHSIGYDYDYTTILSPLENIVYVVWENRLISQIDVKGYTHIRQLIFKNKNGKLFFIPVGEGRLCEITIPIDEASLQHVFGGDYSGSYYTDKNGLYYFSTNGTQQQLESSNGKPVQAVLHERYFIYGDAAYPCRWASGGFSQKQLSLNANELSLINTVYGQYLGDNNQLFDLPLSIRDGVVPISPADFIQQGTPQEPLSNWKFFDIITVGGNLKKNTLYYSSKKIYAGSGSYYSLIKTSNGFYGVTGSSMSLEAVKFNNVMIYNVEKNDYEPIEIDQFRRLTDNFYIYKNRMYSTDSYPVETELDIQKLHAICLNGKATEFYTDGTFLLGGYNLSKLKTEQKGEQTWYKFEEPLFRDVDWESLQIVSEKIMVDKNNIYQSESSLLQVTPIKDLGLDVKVIPLMDK